MASWFTILYRAFDIFFSGKNKKCERTLKSHNANLHLIEQSQPHTRLYYRLYPSLK